MNILLAFDKFKNSMAAEEACEVASRAIRAHNSTWTLTSCPLTDGGEGFARILTQSAGGSWLEVRVSGPCGDEVESGLGIVTAGSIPRPARAMLAVSLKDEDPVAIIEMATASGLAMLSPVKRDPWLTDTRGTGQLLRRAAELGVRAILLGVGGSATNDLGLGALAALGIQGVDINGNPVEQSAPAGWQRIRGFQGRLHENFPPVFIACDVRNPLLGPSGCSAVYGSQKGLRAEDLPAMESGMERMASLLSAHFACSRSLVDEPGMGAAGGIPFGLCCAGAGCLIPGAEFVAAWLDIEERVSNSDIVFTGEGRFDTSSLQGKGPGDVLRRAVAMGKKVYLLAGTVEQGMGVPSSVHAEAISPPGMPLEEALPRGREFLTAAVEKISAAIQKTASSG